MKKASHAATFPGGKMLIDWKLVEQQMDKIRSVEGGFSPARRGLVTLPNGQEIFVKVGTQENTKKWAQKEVAVYRFLEKHHYPHAPRLLAVSEDETAFALEAYTVGAGWNWRESWDENRLDTTLQAMDDLASISLDDHERSFFLVPTVSQANNGWLPLLDSAESQATLIKKLVGIGAESIANRINFAADAERSRAYRFATDTLVHHDIRADNCAWNENFRQVRVVDWNWTQLGDKDIELAATLTHIKKSGCKLSAELLKRLNADALHWMAGFWLNAGTTPIWPGGPEHLREIQLQAGVVALNLREQAER